MRDVRVLLIGGTSHAGKTTLARALAARLGWRRCSTDALARHPGRPWGEVPEHVRAHYRALPVVELIAAQLHHYERLWPAVAQLITSHAGDPAADRLVLEGSGILPARVAEGAFPHTVAYWLTADPATLRARIHDVSGVERRTAGQRLLVERFVGRTAGFDDIIRRDVARCGLGGIDVGAGRPVDELVRHVLDGR